MSEARALLGALSVHGVWYYAHVQIPTDFVYPLLLGAFGACALAWMRRRVMFPRALVLVPFGATLFDYLENTGVLVMLGGNSNETVVRITSICSVGKSVVTSVFMTGLLIVGAVVAIKVIVERTRRAGARA